MSVLSLEEVYVDSHLCAIDDIDEDGSIEIARALVFTVELYKGDKKLWANRISIKKAPQELPKTTEERFVPETTIGEVLTKVLFADINGDNLKEVVVGRADGILVALNLDGKKIWARDLGYFVSNVVAKDVNNDNKEELAVITGDGKLFLLDGSGKKIWVKTYPREYAANDVLIMDVNGDGKDEVLIGMKDGAVLGFDLKGKKVYENRLLNAEVLFLRATDFDLDGKDELLIATDNGHIIVFKPEGDILGSKKLESKIISLSILDINNDKYPEIMASDIDGAVLIFNLKETIGEKSAGREIFYDIDEDGVREKIIRYWKRVSILKGGKEIWGHEYKRWVSAIDVGDINNDGKSEVVVAGLDKFVRIYSLEKGLLASIKTTRAPLSLLSSDFDNDGKVELIVFGEREVRIFRGM